MPHRFASQPFDRERIASELEELAEFVRRQTWVDAGFADRLRAYAKELRDSEGKPPC